MFSGGFLEEGEHEMQQRRQNRRPQEVGGCSNKDHITLSRTMRFALLFLVLQQLHAAGHRRSGPIFIVMEPIWSPDPYRRSLLRPWRSISEKRKKKKKQSDEEDQSNS
ncbi:hypothetical protein QYF36_025093 [Acer negundo]|nr:hypothetical protein QYF36_025093 [Acer negundo]